MKALWIIIIAMVALSAAYAGVELTSARLYYQQGEWDKAVEFFGKALEKDPNDLEAYWERGKLFGEIAMNPERADLAKAVTNNAADPTRELYGRMISDLQRAQKTTTPEEEKVLKKFKKKLDQFQQERWNDFYFAAVKTDTTVTDSMMEVNREGGVAELRGALAELDLAIALVPDRWNSYGQKAQILERLGDVAGADAEWRRAQSVLETSSRKEDNKEQVLGVIRQHLLANGYELDHFEETVKLADEILAKDPASMDAVQYKAFSLAKLAADENRSAAERDKFKSDAIKALNEARKVRGDDPIVVYYMGQFNLELGDTLAAITSFNDYLTLEAGDKDVLFALGVIYLEGGSFADNKKAIETFKTLTDAHADFQAGWQNYGVALVRSGNTAEGKKALEKAKALEGK